MARFLVRRLMVMIALLFVISLVTFLLFIVALPNGGNPAAEIAGRLATPAEVHQITIKYGFNKPIWIQYVKTMGNIFDGSAYSYQSGFNVDQEILAGLPATASFQEVLAAAPEEFNGLITEPPQDEVTAHWR